MGLDTSHNCWHGSYGAFHRWRCKLAEAAGLPPLDLMEGFWSNPNDERCDGLGLSIKCAADSLNRLSIAVCPDDPTLPDVERPGTTLLRNFDIPAISWDILKPDPLHELLHHSDCDGILPAVLCGPLADRLEMLIPLLPEDEGDEKVWKWREVTRQFVDGLRKASAAGEDVDFH